jgi:hypothetical protein
MQLSFAAATSGRSDERIEQKPLHDGPQAALRSGTSGFCGGSTSERRS